MPGQAAGHFLAQLLQAVFEILLQLKLKQALLTLLCAFAAGALTAWLGSVDMAPWVAAGSALLCGLALMIRAAVVREDTADRVK